MKIPAQNQVIFIKNIVAVAAYRSCRLLRWERMSWIQDLLCDHHWTKRGHSISDTSHVSQIGILEDSWRPPKRSWQNVRWCHLTVVSQWCWQSSDLMCCDSVVLPLSSCVSFLDCLHDPSADITSHDISDVAVPMLRFRWWPPWVRSESRKYSFNCLTGQSILSTSDRLRWAIPGTKIHSGACDGSWFLARNPGSG